MIVKTTVDEEGKVKAFSKFEASVIEWVLACFYQGGEFRRFLRVANKSHLRNDKFEISHKTFICGWVLVKQSMLCSEVKPLNNTGGKLAQTSIIISY